MDADSSRKEVVIKTRKPYTITKQRERWTEEEHDKFLEALRLYGRAWQRIEEHIGTKTAVQIRSHAQKFFSKLEKDADVKGIPIGEALDIEIPPPRPKRKPSNPYPRKTNNGTPTSQIRAKDGEIGSASTLSSKASLDLLKEPFPEITYREEQSRTLEQNMDENCTKVCAILPDSPFSSVSSANKIPLQTAESLRNSSISRESIPSIKEVVNAEGKNGSVSTIGHKKLGKDDVKQTENGNSTSKASRLTSMDASQVKLAPHEKSDDLNCPLTPDDMQCSQNYCRHAPVQVLDGSLGAFTQFCSHVHSMGGANGEPSLFADSAVSNASEIQDNRARFTINQSFPSNPQLAPVPNIGDDYHSFFPVSSTFSNLIVSTLLQNPAAQATASLAATFWPYANIEIPTNSQACCPGFTSRQMGSTPSMEAIAAATVAAATAWWAAHGLLPLCAPLRSTFTCAPAPPGGSASIHSTQAEATKTGDDNSLENPPLQERIVDQQHSEDTQVQNSASKSPAVSLLESEENGGAKRNAVPEVIEHEKDTAIAEHNDSNKVKDLKQVDRSSCGSNTPSCSEVETDALLKDQKGKDEAKTAEAIQSASDSVNRRGRAWSNNADSWKAVSEEGRQAFQALFTREVLPQSFSLLHDLENKHQKETIQENHQTTNQTVSTLDINSKKRNPDQQGATKSLSLTENSENEGELTIGIGQGKHKLRRTGFRPYKRCSVEANENRAGHPSNQNEEKGPNVMRLEAGLQLDIHVVCNQR